jgi:hypothetical protein
VSKVIATASERQYVAVVHLRPDQLLGDTPYATVRVRATSQAAAAARAPVTVEQFDYQPDDGVLLALGEGWHEPELQPATGLTWRWTSRRAAVRVHRRPGTTVELVLSGDVPRARLAKSSRIRIVSAGRVLEEYAALPAFSRRVAIRSDPSDACDVDITIESNFSFVPHDLGQSADRRELALRVLDLHVDPLSPSRQSGSRSSVAGRAAFPSDSLR